MPLLTAKLSYEANREEVLRLIGSRAEINGKTITARFPDLDRSKFNLIVAGLRLLYGVQVRIDENYDRVGDQNNGHEGLHCGNQR